MPLFVPTIIICTITVTYSDVEIEDASVVDYAEPQGDLERLLDLIDATEALYKMVE